MISRCSRIALIFVLLLGGTSFCVCSENSTAGITAFTDKTEYLQGEIVKVTLANNGTVNVFSHIASGTPVFCIQYVERKTQDRDWERLFAQCQPPHCVYDIDAPGEIKPGEAETLEWEPLIFVDGTSEAVQAGPGLYRLSILYEDYRKTEWKSVYTNEFRIDQTGGRE